MTARYNGYFYADLRLGEVMDAIDEGYEYNYNDILKVYPDIDSGVINGNKSKLEDAFKKASQVIEWHKSSDWVDDSYLIIGKIRHLQAEFSLAVATLQYINQTSDNEDTKHAALITLMRTYMDAGDTSNVEEVVNYLDLQDLSEENLIDYKVNSAYFHQRMGDIQQMTLALAEVSELISNKNERSRINFILGQVFQAGGRDNEAFDFYKASLAGAPPYELDFHARLNMQQVSPFKSPSQVDKIRETYAKLLKDGKNKEYQGKIYYEMGQFEKKQSNYDLALNNYLKAVNVEESSPRQKSLGYLRTGELHYDVYEKFELASSYYDSTISVMPKDEEGYDNVLNRQMVLSDFVKQLNIIRVNDSLLALAELSPIQLDAYLDIYLDEQEAKEQEEAKEAKKEARVNSGVATASTSSNVFGGNTSGSGSWYFYNETAMSQGELQFQRQWGDRPLEDNWRRSIKESFSADTEETEEDDPILQAKIDEAKVGDSEARKAEKEELLASIPTSPEAKEALGLTTQEAYFKLGDIYRFGLEKVNQSATTYQTLLEKYPETEFRLETLFALYSLYRPIDIAKSDRYKNLIIQEFPESLTAKLLINPNYLEEKEARDKRLQSIYASAYEAYEDGQYFKADQIIRGALASFEDVDFLPTVQYFAAILKAYTENLVAYKTALVAFTEEYPEGPLYDEAKKRIAAIAPPESTGPVDEEFLYSEDFNQLHNVALIINTQLNKKEAVIAALRSYNKENFKEKVIYVGTHELDPGKSLSMFYISPFKTKEEAEAYHARLKQDIGDLPIVFDTNFNNFVISKDNFNVLFNQAQKDIAGYLKFYKRFYK
jgi:hypothetical protein